MATPRRLRINLVHAVPQVAQAYGQDHDGFTAAMEVVARNHDVSWLNVHPSNSDSSENARGIADADFVLVRSDWGWYPCQAADRALQGRADVPVGLLIAGSHAPPSVTESLRFDVLFYETPWYAQFVAEHPFVVEAFGVDARYMHPGDGPRDIDWLMVGRLASFKRPEEILKKEGRRVAVGDLASAPEDLRARLEADGVQVVGFMHYRELAEYYRRARSVLAFCELQGGGERSVVEGQASGCAVEIAPDNPKLASLLEVPVRSHEEYGQRLESAILEVVNGRRIDPVIKRRGQRSARRAVLMDKARRSPSTVVIRARSALMRARPSR